ncbi:MAG: phosphatidylglycerophosphatase A [Puniceicoccales bacterium]|nr:phosphatidylglycerophosphatase A [Puniceicoccales bacterium]
MSGKSKKISQNLNLRDRVVVGIGTCGGIGYVGAAPGTNSSALGVLIYPIIFRNMGWLTFVVSYSAVVLLAIWILSQCERIFHEKDPVQASLDEFIAIPLCFWPADIALRIFGIRAMPLWLWLIAGFLIFRVFDIVKPFGIKKLERMPRGYGIVADDLVAAFATAICLFAIGVIFAI